ncbi:MAG TPA: hypothetical protein VH092_06795 [Urbifossiella sp.]|nr:hypothetical protein [Urbifossiella sp.]
MTPVPAFARVPATIRDIPGVDQPVGSHGDWEPFQKHRIEQEAQRMYPHRQTLKGVEWPLTA